MRNLGGFRGGYEKWMLSNEWKKAYEMLKKIALNCITAILCAEKLHLNAIAVISQEL